ncbi:carbohydrate sulfotransferase 13-like [Littorina saxatilis]
MRIFNSFAKEFTAQNEMYPAAPNLTETSPREQTAESRQLSEAEVASRFEKRRQILKSACQKYSNSSLFRSQSIRSVLMYLYPPVINRTITYCPIQKVGSTTWNAIFRSIHKVMKERNIPPVKIDTPPGKRDVLFAFVREPYGRLLSAYVDKIFAPNTVFWGMTGRYIVQHFRPNASNHSLECGHDVTFPEFVKYVIHSQTTGHHRDGHFIPTHDHCEMCRYPYTYIGHLETVKEDMPFILKAIHSPVGYNRTYGNESLTNSFAMPLRGMRARVKSCMSLDEAARRVWKKMQIRGFIHKSIPFPLTRAHTRNISVEEVQAAGLAASARSRKLTDTRGQKQEAAREAYSMVDMADRDKLQQVLALDCHMFGFDLRPPHIFPATPHTPRTHFSFFDLYE